MKGWKMAGGGLFDWRGALNESLFLQVHQFCVSQSACFPALSVSHKSIGCIAYSSPFPLKGREKSNRLKSSLLSLAHCNSNNGVNGLRKSAKDWLWVHINISVCFLTGLIKSIILTGPDILVCWKFSEVKLENILITYWYTVNTERPNLIILGFDDFRGAVKFVKSFVFP